MMITSQIVFGIGLAFLFGFGLACYLITRPQKRDCEDCGQELEHDWGYCPKCGYMF